MQDIQLFKYENWGYITFLDPLTQVNPDPFRLRNTAAFILIKIWGALCRSMSPNFNVPNINVLHNNGSLLQLRVVEVQSKLDLPKALQINGSIHQQK
jgi:hypothetical protein